MRYNPFQYDISDYDLWYDENYNIYQSEVNAIKFMVGDKDIGLEVGCGTGRFSVPLGINYCVDPSAKMCTISYNKGIKNIIRGDGTYLPLKDKIFDYVLFCTVLCFVENIELTLKEAYRVLNSKGYIIAGIIDKNSFLGRVYEKKKNENKYYKYAKFLSTDELLKELERVNFGEFEIVQTLFDFENRLYDVKHGYGKGGFVVIKAHKK